MTHRAALLIAAALAFAPFAAHAEPAVTIPPPAAEAPAQSAGLETAVLAGGCFWGIQAVYQHVKGVTNAVSGYAGGAQKDAIYDTVSSGRTGHAEAVQVTFDPKQISYGKILQIYFSVAHDPTQLNRQGPDVGWQYRSVIFTEDEAQAEAARRVLDANRERVRGEIVTEITPAKPFWRAEEYHQCYLEKRHTGAGLLGQLLGR
jgi:peptide-methionine (S)-S-oxide reductase